MLEKLCLLYTSINESYSEFAIVPDTKNIRFGLGAIKNVGLGPIEKILEAREEGGKFENLEDFCKRVDATVINKKVMESLVKCGAFDSFGNRDTLLNNIPIITSYASRVQKNALSGQIDIFGTMGMTNQVPPIALEPPTTKPEPRAHLIWERELLGLFISSHPLDDFRNYLEFKTQSIKNFNSSNDSNPIVVGGIIMGPVSYTHLDVYKRQGVAVLFISFLVSQLGWLPVVGEFFQKLGSSI